ncbi:hypothetical protein APR04_003491 [Promicromonospora umidemergens]|uniref:ATP/GTP-binding protein n=1 Tax=Promicromonospora umidemergens TaxID=629679 RepID=A0ABP8Y130_9MICO|nr:PKD domain-containing protein [Promicromonospora umidemergens]MCP2284568.1 hypothetical protein [Promicromonospora umidemergens]
MLRRVLPVLALCASLLVVASPASADVFCNPKSGICTGDAEETDSGGSTGDGIEAPADKPADGGEVTCTNRGKKVPCRSVAGVWNGSCYVKAVKPPPRAIDPVWEGHTDGLIVTCTPPACVERPDQSWVPDCAFDRWIPSLPDPSGPDPEQLALRAVSQMDLNPIDIGIVPEEGPDRVGIVGMPQWMWVNEPVPNTFGPISMTATAGSASVTATASVDKVVWDMGDGTTVTCNGSGTVYEDRFDIMDSPDCGHRYTKQGEYEVTATSYWTVQWEGMGQRGTILRDFEAKANIVMGEAQVITQ